MLGPLKCQYCRSVHVAGCSTVQDPHVGSVGLALAQLSREYEFRSSTGYLVRPFFAYPSSLGSALFCKVLFFIAIKAHTFHFVSFPFIESLHGGVEFGWPLVGHLVLLFCSCQLVDGVSTFK